MTQKILTIALLACLMLPLQAWSQQEEMIAGTAASTEITRLFFEHFKHNPACAEYDFKVMSTPIRQKTAVLTTNRFIFGRIGNPLDDKERQMGKEEILLGTVQLVFAIGLETGINAITLEQLEKIVTRRTSNWKELGGTDAPIMLVGKEKSEPLFTSLRNRYPFFNNVQFDKIIGYDDETSKFLNSPSGAHALAFAAKPNVKLYNYLPVAGFSAEISVGLVYDKSNEPLPVVKAAKIFAQSPEWKKLVKTIDALPVD